jgi:hypothetical protein
MGGPLFFLSKNACVGLQERRRLSRSLEPPRSVHRDNLEHHEPDGELTMSTTL